MAGTSTEGARRPGRRAPSDPLTKADDIIGELVRLQTCAELEGYLNTLCRKIGFDYFSYVLTDRMQLGDEPDGRSMLASSYPSNWQERYRRRRYHQVDPVVTAGRRLRQPFLWGDAEYLHRLTPSDRQVFDEARDFGICVGYTMPVHGPNGECGLFSLAVREDGARCEDAVRESRHLLHVLGSEIHAIMVERLGLTARREAPELTEHERVCLSWTVRGKTAWEISQILDRSRPTIDFHLQKAMRKLDASNKIHAAFKALQAGLI
jgi:DNA-binding CsgD family transcriptional regulator